MESKTDDIRKYKNPSVLKEMHDSGLTQEEIGEKLGVHRTTISEHMCKNGIGPVKDKSYKERFAEKFEKKENGCWEWTAGKRLNGYGDFRIDGASEYAHRASLKLYTDRFDENLVTLHKCDNRSCVNPDHLEMGTHADNLQDARDKGRLNNKGENSTSVKLAESEVLEIRERAKGEETQKEISEDYDVHQCVISRIHNRKRWASLKDE